ncbi:MAG: MarR family winged helix-turn-helix transcriptional regulator [Gaiellales bacterium]
MSNPGSEAWTLLFRLIVSQRGRVPSVAAEFELSPMQAHVLRLLEPDAPLPMRSLARKLCCDASNVTGIVDRLEERGLVRRQESPADRRVKMLIVTPSGDVLRRRMLERLAEAPEPIARLSPDDQRRLRDILQRAMGPL